MTEKSNALARAQLLMLHADTIENDSIKNMVIDSATELAVLHDEIERLRRDAEMMQWLMDNHTAWSWNPSPYNEGLIGGFAAFSTGYFGFDLKTAIRKAMQNSTIQEVPR